MKVKIKKLIKEAVIPSYAKDGDAGMDLTATSKIYDKYGNVSYGTGLAFEIPKGFVGLLFPRSSNAKQTILLTNSVGVLDSGYRGEVFFKFKPSLAYFAYIDEAADAEDFDEFPPQKSNNYSDYNIGDRVGQLMIIPHPQIDFEEVDELSTSERGEGGHGSSGK